MFDLSAQTFRRLGLTRYVVFKLNYSIIKSMRLHMFKAISTEKEVKYTFSSKHLFESPLEINGNCLLCIRP